MKKPLALTLSISLILQTILMPWIAIAAPMDGPGAPTPPPIVITPSYEIEGGFTGRIIQTQQMARAAQKASITLLIGGVQDNFPALPSQPGVCINNPSGPPPYAYSIQLDNSFILMSQCEANNNDFVRQNDPFIIIDPFKDYLTKATSTEISTALVAKGTLGTAFTITRSSSRYVTLTRTDNSEGNIIYTDNNGTSASTLFQWSSVPGQSALPSRVQQSEYVPSNPRYNERFNMVVDNNTYEYIVQEDDTVADVVAGLVSAYNSRSVSGITCTNDTTRVLCTASSDAVAFATNTSIIYEIPDGIAPQIIVGGQNFVGTQTGTVYVEAGSEFSDSATWIDNRYGSGTITGNGDVVDTTLTGSYVRTYSLSDPEGNTSAVTITYIVRDTTAPDLIMNGIDTITQELDNGSYYDEGANWTDNLDGSGYITGTIIDDERTLAGTGRYYLSYDFTDASGNNAGSSRSITVVDTLAPSISKIRIPTNPIDADVYFVDWNIRGANSVSLTGTSLTGTYTPKKINTSLYRIFVPLLQNTTSYFTLTATDLVGNTATRTFSLIESGTGEIGQVNPLTSTGGNNLIDISDVIGTSTGATKLVPKVPTIIRDIVGEWSASVVIPMNTEITRKDGGTFDATKIATKIATVTGGLTGTDRSRGAIDFGPTGIPLLFSKPIQIEFYVDRNYTGSTIEVKVRHAGETTFTTSGLTNNPNATCSNGIPSSGTNIANVDTESHTVSIYTCAASTYAAVTPDGPQNPTPVVSTPSTPTGNSSGGGSFSSYSAPVSTVSTQPIQAINTGTVASTSSVTWTQVFPKKPTKKLETYTLKLTEANKKNPEYVVLPVGFKNGTKIKIRLIAKNGKTFTTTTTVKNGKITFRPRVSGTYEVIKK